MLRAQRRLLRPGGRLAFITITVSPGLPPTVRRRAIAAGPRAVASRAAQEALLASAGFTGIVHEDLTKEFARTADAWRDHDTIHADAIRAAWAPGVFDTRRRERQVLSRAVAAGWLQRGLYVAVNP